jgi:hypothetical protein
MSQNKSSQRKLIENMVMDDYEQRSPDFDMNKFFELFVATQILKDHNLSDDELLSGIPNGGTRDGGIDGLYLFYNHQFIPSGTEPELDRQVTVTNLQLHIIQCKYTDRITEDIIHKLVASMTDFLDLNNDLNSSTMTSRYSPDFIDTIQTFRSLYQKSRRGVKIKFNFYIAHLRDDVPLHLEDKRKHLYSSVKKHIEEAETELDFLGPHKLVALVRREPKKEYTLEYKRDVISPDEAGFVCLVNLRQFFNFIHDPNTGTIRENMFEANVRDYQLNSTINSEIADSLAKPMDNIDFWWLNNGITMVAEKVTRRGDGLIIENPEIVNGLQTSYTIHRHYTDNSMNEGDKRHILVRIIQLSQAEDQPRDLIIRATNRQTPIPPLLLHATETIHHDIEDFLRKCSPPLFYERRKSHYRNKGRKIAEIVDMQTLAQAVAAVLLRRPDDARTRIRAFLTNEENYSHVFDRDYPYDLYHICAIIRKQTEAFLNSEKFSQDPLRRAKGKYVLHHIMTDIALVITRNSDGVNVNPEKGRYIYATQIAAISPSQINESTVQASVERVMGIFENSRYLGLPNSAKGKEMVKDIIDAAKQSL